MQSGELGGNISFDQVIHQVGLQPVLGVQNNGDIFKVRTQLSVVLAVCPLILVNIFLIREENYLVWIGWFLMVREDFITAAGVEYSAGMVLKKDRFFTLRNTRNSKLSNECLYTFL